MLNVRRAEIRDIPAILNLLVQVDLVHHNGRPDLFKGPATKYNAAELETILTDEETPVFVCTDAEDRVLGHGFCVMQHSGGQLLVEHTTVYIDDICVDEAARGKGVGRYGLHSSLCFPPRRDHPGFGRQRSHRSVVRRPEILCRCAFP